MYAGPPAGAAAVAANGPPAGAAAVAATNAVYLVFKSQDASHHQDDIKFL